MAATAKKYKVNTPTSTSLAPWAQTPVGNDPFQSNVYARPDVAAAVQKAQQSAGVINPDGSIGQYQGGQVTLDPSGQPYRNPDGSIEVSPVTRPISAILSTGAETPAEAQALVGATALPGDAAARSFHQTYGYWPSVGPNKVNTGPYATKTINIDRYNIPGQASTNAGVPNNPVSLDPNGNPYPAGSNNGGATSSDPNSPSALLQAAIAAQQATGAKNNGIIDSTVGPAVTAQGQLNNGLMGMSMNALGVDTQATQDYGTGNAALTKQLTNATGTASSGIDALANPFNSSMDQSTGIATAGNNQLISTLGGEQVLAPTPYQGAYNSNPTDVSNQLQSLATLQGVGAGSLNYTAAQAASNPGDVAAQTDALNMAKAVAGGSLNYSLDPADLAAQNTALGKFKSLSDPQVTAQEQFLYEQQRMKEEQDRSNANAGVLNDLQARGMSGSGMQVGNMLGSDQITSQNRLLGDLGTQATAVQRAQQNLEDYGTLASTMQGQSGQVSSNNQTTQMQGVGQYNTTATNMRNASDNMSMTNAGFTNTALANNQRTMMQGDISAADQSNQIRTADDAIGMFNNAQLGISNVANDKFRAQAQEDQTTRAADLATNANSTAGVVSNNAMNKLSGGSQIIQTSLGDKLTGIQGSSQLADKTLSANQAWLGAVNNTGQTVSNIGQGTVNNQFNIAGLKTNNNWHTTDASTGLAVPIAGLTVAQQAALALGGSSGSGFGGSGIKFGAA